MLRSAASPHVTPTDAELLHLFLQSRDDAAFGRLVARHGEPVRRVATRATGNPSAAEDVAQAAFIVMSRRPRAAWVSACCRGSALPWLVRTTRYAASTWRRTEARRRRHETAAALPERVDPSRPGELTEAVAAALSRMNRGERRLITLRHLDEKPWPDVAQQVGMTPEAARKATARALARLRERLCSGGVIVTPAALAIALSTLARPSHAAITLTTTTSAFQIARGVLTMMKIQTAGVAGTALLAAVMSVGVIGGGFGSTPTLAAGTGSGPASQDRGAGRNEEERETARGQEQAAREDDRPEKFTANEHQPSVTLSNGTKLTLLAISNTEDGWWHADGTRSQAPRHYLPRGMSLGSMNVTSDSTPLIDMVLLSEGPAEGVADRSLEIVDVLIGDRQQPQTTGVGINSNNNVASLRIMVTDPSDTETAEAFILLATGKPQKVGEIRRDADGAWQPDEAARKWVAVENDEASLYIDPGQAEGRASAVSVLGSGEGGVRQHGYINPEQRLAFEAHALRDVQVLEVYQRPMDIVHLSGMARKPEQDAEAQMRLDDRVMIRLTTSHVVTAGAGTASHNSIHVGGHATVTAGGGNTVTAQGSGGATATAGGGSVRVTSQGGTTTVTSGGSGRTTAQQGGGSGASAGTTRPSQGGRGGAAGGGGAGQNQDDPDDER